MIQRLLKHKESVLAVINGEGHKHKLSLPTQSEWDKLNTTSKLLEPLELATKQLGGEKYVSASSALPMFSHLLVAYKTNEDDPGYVTRFKTALTTDLQARKDVLLMSMHVKVCTALDPRFKTLKSTCKPEREPVWNFIKNTIRELASDRPSLDRDVGPAPKSRKVLFDFESDDDSVEQEADEFTRYMMSPKPDDDAEPLLWWKSHAASFPNISTLARKYLCSPATSVPCERLFSKAGCVITKKRASLKPSTAEKLICLGGWLPE